MLPICCLPRPTYTAWKLVFSFSLCKLSSFLLLKFFDLENKGSTERREAKSTQKFSPFSSQILCPLDWFILPYSFPWTDLSIFTFESSAGSEGTECNEKEFDSNLKESIRLEWRMTFFHGRLNHQNRGGFGLKARWNWENFWNPNSSLSLYNWIKPIFIPHHEKNPGFPSTSLWWVGLNWICFKEGLNTNTTRKRARRVQTCYPKSGKGERLNRKQGHIRRNTSGAGKACEYEIFFVIGTLKRVADRSYEVR